jgi:hypothetical protein
MRILLAIAGNQFTSQEIAEKLPDIAHATLYRHIAKLHKAGVLLVVEAQQKEELRYELELWLTCNTWTCQSRSAALQIVRSLDSSFRSQHHYYRISLSTLDIGRAGPSKAFVFTPMFSVSQIKNTNV